MALLLSLSASLGHSGYEHMKITCRPLGLRRGHAPNSQGGGVGRLKDANTGYRPEPPAPSVQQILW